MLPVQEDEETAEYQRAQWAQRVCPLKDVWRLLSSQTQEPRKGTAHLLLVVILCIIKMELKTNLAYIYLF